MTPIILLGRKLKYSGPKAKYPTIIDKPPSVNATGYPNRIRTKIRINKTNAKISIV